MTNKSEIEIVVASGPDRDSPVAEVWVQNEMFFELRHEGLEVRIQIYPRRSATPWDFPVEEFLRLVAKATARLGPPPTDD